MKALILAAAIALGVALILYFRVNVGLEWAQMAAWLEQVQNDTLAPLVLLVASQVGVFLMFQLGKKYLLQRRERQDA